MDTLHPMAVHLPITLALLWPVIDAIGLLTGRKDVSKVGVGLLLLAIVASIFATATGQAAFDVALTKQVDPHILNVHADDANLMPWAMLLAAAVRIGGAAKLQTKGQVAGIVVGLLLYPLVLTVGNSGGDLVYEHAVNVKTSSTSAAPR